MKAYAQITAWARWAGWRKAAPDALNQVIMPDAPSLVYAVGDVHGCFDLYRQMEDDIAAEVAAKGAPALLILLGDFIDRGPQSAQMLDHLLGPAPPLLTRCALMGNHEDMFVQFMRKPRPDHPWLHHGGAETLRSYGMRPENLPRKLALSLTAHIPSAHIDFLANLPLALHMPGLMFSHAGANPMRAPQDQTKSDLLWGDPALLDSAPLSLRVVHGHIPTSHGQPLVTPARVNVDTGAYATGVLTAAKMNFGEPLRFKVVRRA
jgi:serine/threonine protein phosphatase 1